MSVTLNGTTGLTFGDGTTQPNAGFTGFRNLLINGNFDFWQRGTSFSSATLITDPYSADRWKTVSGAGTRTHARNAFASPYPVPGATYYLTIAPTVAGYHAIQQSIEGAGKIMSGKTYTVSFWAKAASTTNIIFISNLDNDSQPATVTAGSNGTSTNISLTTSWAKYYYTFTVPTWDGSNANRYLRFLFGNGSGTDLPPTVDIAQIQLEQGAYFTQFEFRPIQTELAMCQRYYEVIDYISCMFPWSSGAQVIRLSVPFAVEKRTAAPSVTLGAKIGGTGTMGVANNGSRGMVLYGSGGANDVVTYQSSTVNAEI